MDISRDLDNFLCRWQTVLSHYIDRADIIFHWKL
jgi:hypothetical protein